MSDEVTGRDEAALTAEEIGWLAAGAAPLRVPETVFRAARRIKAQARREGAAEVVARVEAVDLACELYDEPGQDCITAGPEVFAADGCTSCHVRAALRGDA